MVEHALLDYRGFCFLCAAFFVSSRSTSSLITGLRGKSLISGADPEGLLKEFLCFFVRIVRIFPVLCLRCADCALALIGDHHELPQLLWHRDGIRRRIPLHHRTHLP